MDAEKIIEQAKQNIHQAVSDYWAHVSDTNVLDGISDEFVEKLAEDSTYAKMELRELFSQSPVWNSKLDALVINGTRTHDPDLNRVYSLTHRILRPAVVSNDLDYSAANDIADFFASSESYEAARERQINTIKRIAPKAYAPNKKQSRVFKAICDALHISDDTAGSEFQRLYAQFADELTAKKISFKLYVSINPAHFLTMSNPKWDERGETLTSCHSFNNTQYSYNCGCTGYARDKYSFIVFTAADPRIPETLNNRKTTRQIFAYKPGNGLLLQSRLYNTSGGTTGAQEESKVYRDLIQREISALENVPNLWKTYTFTDGKTHCVQKGSGFGGYEDWIYSDFNAKVSIRADHAEDYGRLKVGTYGLCICCGEKISSGLYCGDCQRICTDCGCRGEDLTMVYDSDGRERYVCDRCLDDYTCCERCGDYYPNEDMSRVGSDEYVCQDCLHEYFTLCESCGDYHPTDEMCLVIGEKGRQMYVCEDCRDQNYTLCEHCGRYTLDDDLCDVHDADGNEGVVCEECYERYYICCDNCGEAFLADDVEYAEEKEDEIA